MYETPQTKPFYCFMLSTLEILLQQGALMKIQWPNNIRTATMVLALLFGVGIVFSGVAQAQNDRYPQDRQDRRDRNLDQYGNYGGSGELRQTALNAGHNDGVREAANTSQNTRRANFQLSNAYRRATNGYNRSLGDRELYRRYYREGFENGYNNSNLSTNRDNRNNQDWNRDGRNNGNNNNGNQTRHGRNWDGYTNYGGSFELRQTALNAGYNEGIKEGRNDRNKRNRADYRNQNNYRNATQDYSSKLGDRAVYQRYYRDAFGNGYEDGLGGN
jgi:hypothetical protein